MSEWNYFVTAQRPTVVTHALGPLRFTSAASADLVVARCTRLEIYRLCSNYKGLEMVSSVQMNGRVHAMQILRPTGGTRDFVVVLTEKRQFVLLRYDADAHRIASVAAGSLTHGHDRSARLADFPPICKCDPHGHVAALYLYEGLLKVVVLDSATSDNVGTEASISGDVEAVPVDLREGDKIFGARMAEPRVLDLAFLHASLADDMSGEVRFDISSSSQTGRGANTEHGTEASSRPQLAVLHADGQGHCFVSAWAIDAAGHSLSAGTSWRDGATVPAKAGSSHIEAVPTPLGGALILGSEGAAYHDNSGRCIAEVSGGPTRIVTAVRVDITIGTRWVVGSEDGNLWLLRLEVDVSTSAALTYEHLGVASPPSAIVCLPEGHIFIGSSGGDSQLLRLSNQCDRQLHVIETWTNLGPVVDFCIADTDDQGQNQVATCSGIGHTGSIRLVRIGVGVHEVGSLDDIGAVLGMWALGGDGSPGIFSLLVLSFMRGTRVLAFTPSNTATRSDGQQALELELAECTAPGFSQNEESLLACEFSRLALQVTRSGVRAASRDKLALVDHWMPPGKIGIQVATAAYGEASGFEVIVGFDSGELAFLQFHEVRGSASALKHVARCQLVGEPSCLHAKDGLVAAGLWTRNLQVCRLETAATRAPLRLEELPSDTIPRSVAFAKLAEVMHLLVALADGRLVSFQVDQGSLELHQRRIVHLGVQPAQLLPFRSQDGSECVLSTGDRPTIVHAHSHAPVAPRLAYAAVNLRQVGQAAAFGVDSAVGGCLALVSDRRLILGTLEKIQRVHVRTMPLGEAPFRISYQRQVNVFAVGIKRSAFEAEGPICSGGGPITAWGEYPGSSSSSAPACSSGSWRSSASNATGNATMDSDFGWAVRILHGRSLETLQILPMQQHENVSAMCAATFEGEECLVVGTAFVVEHEPEPSNGRIMIYTPRAAGVGKDLTRGAVSFDMLCSLRTNGAVYNVQPFQGMLLGSVNNCVNIWKLNSARRKLDLVCSYSRNILSLFISSIGNHILIGDLMRSACLLVYNPEAPDLKEVANDARPCWLTAIAMPTENLFFCTDDRNNMFLLKRKSATDRDEDAYKLEHIGHMYTGEFVNAMHRATLVTHPAEIAGPTSGFSTPTSPNASLGTPALPTGRGAGADSGGRSYTLLSQVVWASVDGAIGLVATFRGEREFARLSLIQDAVCREVHCLAGLPHGEWRNCSLEIHGTTQHKGFIDGDLLETVLDMPRVRQQAVVDYLQSCGVTVDGVEGLLREVHEFAQLH